MKLKINKNIFLEQLNIVSKALSNKNIIPVLSSIKLDLLENGLFLTASDNDMIIQSFIEKDNIINIEQTGSIVVVGKLLLEIIRKLPTDEIILDLVDNNKLYIKNEQTEFYIIVIDVREYPDYDFELSKNPIIINSNVLKEIVNRTHFCSSLSEVRPILTGINITIKNDILTAVATDSYRLAKYSIKLDNQVNDNEYDLNILSKNIVEYIRMLDDNIEVEINIFSNKCIFKTKGILFQTKLLNGTFPNTSNLVPNSFKFNIKCPVNKLYDSIDRVSLLTVEKDKYIINFKLSTDCLVASSISAEIGKVEDTLEVENPSNEMLNISFNARYMLEALKAIETDNACLYFNTEQSHIILKEEDNEEYVQIIPPIIC